ncbi:Solute carrier family 22 member 13 [Strongyloides ratti]|uniref:Solute carrier family 22 member 13 n=1 Tax=Strongyloides ratti TaxID=34506 RepID=A0A090KU23_STRRB|nr:Solute carrier family 22 member 13 [Strongyloides ratti]CEF60921.1 Solute carrier family 22 member 13 [Strongyloides ratti]
MKFDEILFTHLGEFGKYQSIQFFLLCIPTIFTAMHSLSWTFTAPNIKHRCRLPNEEANSSYWMNPIISKEIPLKEECKNFVNLTDCSYETCHYGLSDSCTNGYIYDKSHVTYSATHRWDIVCDKTIWRAFIQSAYYIGQMIGSIGFGKYGDKYGRKRMYFIALCLQIFAGSYSAFANNLIVFGLLRFLLGISHPGLFMISIIIMMELIGPSKRKLPATIGGMSFSFGEILLGIFAYFFRDYRHLQLIIGLPSIIFLSYYWLVGESIRWLVTKKRYNEADKLLKKGGKINGSQIPNEWWDTLDTDEDTITVNNKTKNYGYLDLFRTPKLCKRSLISFYCWPVVSMIFYGVSMKPDFLGGDPYMTFIIGGFMEIPALLLMFFTVNKIGRKPLLAGGYLVSAGCMVISQILSHYQTHWIVNLILYATVKAAITCVYTTIYTFTPELFPTVIRNSAMGLCSTFSRLGAILASYVSFWLVTEYGNVFMVIPFAILSSIAGILVLLCLPETVGIPLLETIEELENGENKKDLLTTDE